MGHPIDWFNRLDFRKAIWLAPLVWTLHEAEEWDINAFQRQHFADPGFLYLVDHGVLWIILGFVALVGIVWTCLTAWPKNPKFAAFLTLPVFIVFSFGNVLQHIGSVFLFREYMPGLITAVLLVGPVVVGLTVKAVRGRLIPWWYATIIYLLIIPSLVDTARAVVHNPPELPSGIIRTQQVGLSIARLILGDRDSAAESTVAPPNAYRSIDTWLHAPAGRMLGAASGAAAASDGTLWISERCGANDCSTSSDIAPILHADANGNVLGSFGAGRFAWPHGIRVDADGDIWVTDARGGNGRGHQVLKFAPDGKLLLALGEAGVAGGDTAHFDGPTDVAVAPNGDVFVSDGHEDASNNRILKFSPDGKFIKQWGRTGSKPGEFLVPHALAFDSRGRLFVADRDNNRIQVFDQDGRFLAEWTQFGRPSGLYIAADDTLYVSDNQSNTERHPGWPRGIRVGSARDGKVTAFIPDPEFDPARSQETGAHGLTADAGANIYGAEVFARKVKKYALK